MQEITDFSLEKLSETDSRLLFQQAQCHTHVDGLVLEAQYRLVNGYFLIFTSDDCPFEEGLHLLLLNDRYNLIDGINIGLPYNPAIFYNPRVISDNVIEFEFFNDETYRLSIDIRGVRFQCAKPRFEISYCRAVFQKRYLKLDRVEK